MAEPYTPQEARFKLDENIMDLWGSVFAKNDPKIHKMVSTDADTVELEQIRGRDDDTVLRYADKDQRTVLTGDTDCLLAHWSSQTSVILLWGKLENVRFVRLKRKVRGPVVKKLFDTHRKEIDEIYKNRKAMMAILSGIPDDYTWTLREPTPEEMDIFFAKSIYKEKALPFLDQEQW